MFAARVGVMDVAKILVGAGAHVNHLAQVAAAGSGMGMNATPSGGTPLLTAIVRGHVELAKYLLDQGADPNKLVKVSDRLDAMSSPSGKGRSRFGHFVTLRAAKAGEVFRGVAFAPAPRDD